MDSRETKNSVSPILYLSSPTTNSWFSTKTRQKVELGSLLPPALTFSLPDSRSRPLSLSPFSSFSLFLYHPNLLGFLPLQPHVTFSHTLSSFSTFTDKTDDGFGYMFVYNRLDEKQDGHFCSTDITSTYAKNRFSSFFFLLSLNNDGRRGRVV